MTINLVPDNASASMEKAITVGKASATASHAFKPFEEPALMQTSFTNTAGAEIMTLNSTASQEAIVLQTSGSNPFIIKDDKQVWTNSTEIELFKASYDGSVGITVLSNDGDSVVAPGTSNYYTFAVQNNSSMAMDYQIVVETYLNSSIVGIPLLTKLTNDTGSYVVGGKDLWVNVLDMNGLTDAGVLAAGNQSTYTLGWYWPFESGIDVFDTALGVAAQGEDITLTIVIKTICTANTTPGVEGGTPPRTGDNDNIIIWATLAIVAFFTMMFLLLWKSKEDSNEEKPQKIETR